jgi:hypothetical protein
MSQLRSSVESRDFVLSRAIDLRAFLEKQAGQWFVSAARDFLERNSKGVFELVTMKDSFSYQLPHFGLVSLRRCLE